MFKNSAKTCAVVNLFSSQYYLQKKTKLSQERLYLVSGRFVKVFYKTTGWSQEDHFWVVPRVVVLYRFDCTLIGTSTLQTLIFLSHMYWMPNLEKTRIINNPQIFCYVRYEISANYPLFLKIKLDRSKTIPIFVSQSLIYQN